MESKFDMSYLILLFAVSIFLAIPVLIDELQASGVQVWHSRWALLIYGLLGIALLATLLFLLSFHKKFRSKLTGFVEGFLSRCWFCQNIAIFAFVLTIFTHAWLFTFSPYRDLVQLFWFKATTLLLISSLFTLLFKSIWPRLDTRLIFLANLVLQSVVLKTASLLTRVSPTPFVLTWEENYRLYYASLLAAERLYGMKVPLSPIDFSLNLLNGIPFLLGDFPIWAHRLWYVLLTIGTTLLTAWSLARRLHLSNNLHRWLLIGLAWLYLLMEGGVKYNLQVAVILVLLTVHPRYPWRSLVGVLLASFWAGLSRVNWLPVPAMLAISLYILEESISHTNIKKYLSFPALLTIIGLGSALAGSWLVSTLPNGDHSTLSSMLRQGLLWYRLFPNATYAPGILIPLFLVSAPLWYLAWRGLTPLHWLRKAGLIAMMLILLGGGIVASVKIGGGSDLHNLDAYFVFLMVLAAYAFFGRLTPDARPFISSPPAGITWALAIFLITPVISVLNGVRPYLAPDFSQINSALRQLQTEIDKIPEGREILVMYQRPLVTFGYLEVALVPEYESVFVLEMAMSQDMTYLERLKSDLCKHRFEMILAEYQPRMLKGKQYSFGEENDVWYQRITLQLLNFYEISLELPEAGLQLYTPKRTTSVSCPP